MAFLGRFFKKTSSSNVRTSAAAAATTAASARSSSSSEEDGISPPTMPGVLSAPEFGIGMAPGRRLGTSDRSGAAASSLGRRAGGEIRRSQTYTGTGTSYASVQPSTRPSMSSCDGTSFEDRLRQQYAKLRQTHVGRLAVILEGVDRRSKQPVVIKAYSKAGMTASMLEQVEREQAILRTAASCPGVVRLLDHLDDAANCYIVMENVPGYTLIELMAQSGGRLHEARCARDVAAPMLRALAALHALGIVHRDVKPEHLICAPSGAKLVDFAHAAQQRHQCLNSRVGQLEYMAPEVLSKPTAADIFHTVLQQGMSEGELPQYDEKADVWSAGCVVFEALTGQQPFMAETPLELAALHNSLLTASGADAAPLLLQHPAISAPAREFLAAVLQADPARRPSALDLLQHPWLTQHAAAGRTSTSASSSAPPPWPIAPLGSPRVVMESSSGDEPACWHSHPDQQQQQQQRAALVGQMAAVAAVRAGLGPVPQYRTSTSASALPDHHTMASSSSSNSSNSGGSSGNNSRQSSLSVDVLAVAAAAGASAPPRPARSPLQGCCMSASPRASLGELKAGHQQQPQQQARRGAAPAAAPPRRSTSVAAAAPAADAGRASAEASVQAR